jgi:hypothetical protein
VLLPIEPATVRLGIPVVEIPELPDFATVGIQLVALGVQPYDGLASRVIVHEPYAPRESDSVDPEIRIYFGDGITCGLDEGAAGQDEEKLCTVTKHDFLGECE